MLFTRSARRVAGAVLTLGLIVPAVPALGAADAAVVAAKKAVHQPKKAKPASKVVPFTAASVTDAVDGAVTVSWTVAKNVTVKVYEGTLAKQTTLVGTKKGSGSLPATVPAGSRGYFRLVPSQGVALVVAPRDLGLATDPNLRDAGGYRTTSGQWVKTGVLYRGQQMAQGAISDADAAFVDTLGLSSIYDLRTDGEINGGSAIQQDPAPDIAVPGAKNIHLNVLGGDADLSSYVSSIQTPEAADEAMTEGEVAFVDAASAKAAYRALFTDIANDKGASLYHCTAGKDRTGWASAALLTLLGVPAGTVMSDYLLSHDYYWASPDVQQKIASYPYPGITVLLDVRAAWLQAGLDQVATEYGSMQKYFTDGLGIDAGTIAKLKKKLLVGHAVK